MTSKIVVDNPATGETYVEVPLMDRAEVESRVRRAEDAQEYWRRYPLHKRVGVLERFCKRLLASKAAIARDITGMMGKPLVQAEREVVTMVERAAYMASIAEAALGDEVLPEKPGLFRKIVHEAVGTVLDIAPWNYPLLAAINVIAPAVLAGNAVLIKHSSRTPLVADHLARAFAEAGVPEGLVAALHVDHATVERLISSRLVDYVHFTGSTEAGREIYRRAAEKLLGCGLELGGKDPAYVAADADVQFAAENIVDGATWNAGQNGCSVERVYVHRSLYGEFVEAALAEIQKHRLGDPFQPETTMGPLARKGAPEELARKVAAAKAAGARVLSGGNPTTVGGKGRFFEPALVVDCTQKMDIMVEECFGPVLPIMSVDDDDHAAVCMNDSRYGLTASIWTGERGRAEAMTARIQAGTVYMNRCDYLDPALAWTGYKESGIGVTLSKYGFAAMTRLKSWHYRLQ